RVVLDKVEDFAEQFREFGPQFRVVVLDVKDKNYRDKYREIAKEFKEFDEAVKSIAEDSIVVLAQGRAQRLGFQEIFQVDKKASRDANDKQGNLVMQYQGSAPFARAVLNVDAKKPRIAFGVALDAFSSRGIEDLGLAGAKKTLNAHGF